MAGTSFNEFRKRVGTKGGGKFAADKPAPVGTHIAVIKVALAREEKNNPFWRLRVKFEIDNGPHAGTSSWWSRRYDPADEDGLQWFFGAMDALEIDWDADEIPADGTDAKALTEAVASQLAGKRAQIKVKEGKPYGGRVENEVSFINPLPEGAPPPQKAQAAAGMAQVAKASSPASPAVPAKPKTTAAPNPLRDQL